MYGLNSIIRKFNTLQNFRVLSVSFKHMLALYDGCVNRFRLNVLVTCVLGYIHFNKPVNTAKEANG
jgi:hypothetical protein